MSLKALSDYTVYSRYAHYLPEKKRRETWDEMVDRVFGMHEKKFEKSLEEYPEFRSDFEFAREMVKKKRVLGSQRALQFGGAAIEKHNAKMFNCTFSYIDRVAAFQESMYLLLCGCGVGFSVQHKHVSKLPKIFQPNKEKKVFCPQDSIEGWSDCVGVLVSSYFEGDVTFPEYQGHKVEFDFSQIREEGSLIAGQFKAPGPDGLRESLKKVKTLFNDRLEKGENTLHPIDAYDLIMHVSDAVLSGGVRRSATICLFSKDDGEMLNAKTGDWFTTNPQRGRSNNSALLVRDQITHEEFSKLIESTKQFGEPGFVFSDTEDSGYNPCLPKWAKVLTKNGILDLEYIKEGDEIWSETGWTTVTKKWSTGVKQVFEYKTTAGTFYGTENHRILSNGEKIEVKNAQSIDVLQGEYSAKFPLDSQDIMDGLVLGDGSVHKASNDLVYLFIGENDKDYFKSEIASLITKHRPGLTEEGYEIISSITAQELPPTYQRSIPNRFFYGDKSKVAGFLRGLYTANGSICGDRITLKAASFKLISQVQVMLSGIGIKSYYTTNKPSNVVFSNGEYTTRESYDLNITTDKYKFYNIIGFIQNYKQDKLSNLVNKPKSKFAGNRQKVTFDIIGVSLVSEEEVFDITVDNESHTFWNNGLNISNCVEINLYPQTEDGRSGFHFCNLTEGNGRYCDTEEKFLEVCRASAILGTMQAAYTDFKYVTKETKEITDREALLGCSITGIMDNPEIILNPEIQRKGAEEVKRVNKKIAKLIGINPSARTTCVKPAGSTSCVLGSASGIHPHHAKRYIRRVQANRNEFPLQYFKKVNPLAVEKSVWSTNGTDEVISFICEVPKGAIVKNQLRAVELLDKVKLTQQNWVEYGTNVENCMLPSLRHNVSNTITVKDNEWDEVRDYIFENRSWFAGISLLSASGDLDYAQAPFTTVLNPAEMVQEYGDGAILASGIVVDGLEAFNENLWAACDCALGFGEKLDAFKEPKEPKRPRRRKDKSEKQYMSELLNYSMELHLFYQDLEKYNNNFMKLDWIRRAKQFAERYFNNDLRKMTHCLKHCYSWKQWLDLKREYKNIDWSEVLENQQEYVNADTLGAQACTGGSCELK